MGAGHTVVVLLPDSGALYLSKFYDDQWMKEWGFFEPESTERSVADLLRNKSHTVHTARPQDTVGEAILALKREGISQMPVIGGDNEPVGMIHEVDLLNAVIEGKLNRNDIIESLCTELQGVIDPSAPIEQLRTILAADNAAVVVEGGRLLGIITKIDLIEYLS